MIICLNSYNNREIEILYRPTLLGDSASPSLGVIIAGPCIAGPCITDLTLDLELFKHGMVRNSNYVSTEDLLALDSLHPQSASPTPAQRTQYCSPLVWKKWSELLEYHTDRRYVDYVLTGIRDGSRIGFNREQRLQNATRNLPSQVPAIISDYLAREVSLGRMVKLPPGYHLVVFTSALLESFLRTSWGSGG